MTPRLLSSFRVTSTRSRNGHYGISYQKIGALHHFSGDDILKRIQNNRFQTISKIIFRCCALAQSMLTGHTPGNGKDSSDCNSRFLKAFAEKRLQTDERKSNQCCQELQKGDSLNPTKHRRELGQNNIYFRDALRCLSSCDFFFTVPSKIFIETSSTEQHNSSKT